MYTHDRATRTGPRLSRNPAGVFACTILSILALTGCGPKSAETDNAATAVGTGAGNPGGRSAGLNYHALVIGIDAYEAMSGDGWSRLSTARSDAEAVAGLLEREYGFRVRTLLDAKATRSAIISELDSLVSLGANDALAIYFAGHGFYDKDMGEGYWIPSDARRKAGSRYAKEDWLWNSTITKILNACAARHVLVIADSCFAGSLFRGEKNEYASGDMRWYGQAMMKPSRYLIASGDLEPVLDSGVDHSVFGQQLLTRLEHPDRPVFSASELAIGLREEVADVTGQLVQMGPLAMAGHGGGEFVFVKTEAEAAVAEALSKASASDTAWNGMVRAETASEREESLKDALDLSGKGASNAVGRIMDRLTAANADDRLAAAVMAYVDREKRAREQTELRNIISEIEKRETRRRDNHSETTARPRIISCLGPEAGQTDGRVQTQALLYRICLRDAMARTEAVQLVEREGLESILSEMNVGTSDLSDDRARTAMGRLLPAGMLLLGDVFPMEDGGEKLYLRLVDTETSRIEGAFCEQRAATGTVADVCEKAAKAIVKKAASLKPLTAKVTRVTATAVEAEVGRFHGARQGMVFDLVMRIPQNGSRGATEFEEKKAGKAVLTKLGEESSSLTVEGTPVSERDGKILWVRESVR